jgi:P27 family predicted phage terminase small subunit
LTDDVLAPTWLKPLGQEKWRELWAVLGPTDGDLVAMYCQAYADFREACDHIGRAGAIVKGPDDRVMPNPYVSIRDAAMRQMTELGKLLGLSPMAVSWEDFAPMVPRSDEDGEPGTVADEQH